MPPGHYVVMGPVPLFSGSQPVLRQASQSSHTAPPASSGPLDSGDGGLEPCYSPG